MLSTLPPGPASDITPRDYARRLLDSLAMQDTALVSEDGRCATQLWAASGAMWLSGYADGRVLMCPAPLASCAQGAWLALCSVFPQQLDPGFCAFQLLGERAAIAGLSRQGRSSPGQACQLLDTADGFIALNLARAEDTELLPAWLEQSDIDLERSIDIVATRATAELIHRARLLGLAAAPMRAPEPAADWFRASRYSAAVNTSGAQPGPLVVDLSSLWAGPLCGQLLTGCGATVVKVESLSRPDGARSGPEQFYHLMNSDKFSVALDFKTAAGRADLKALVQRADIVIEASRPRALQQLGIHAESLLREKPGKVWLSITGYGRQQPMAEWLAYGDDAGVAAGLSWLLGGHRGDPVFCGDAIADPLTGLHGALLAAASWRKGGGELLELALSGVVAHCIDSAEPVRAMTKADQEAFAHLPVAEPVAREVVTHAADLGAHTDVIMRKYVRS